MSLATDESELIWFPSYDNVASANLTSILEEYGFTEYEQLDALLTHNDVALEEFYEKLIKRFDFTWQKKWDNILNLEGGIPFAKWFSGAQWNAVENALDRWIQRGRGQQAALIWEDEEGASRQLSYVQLREQTARCALALQKLGIGVGSTVGIWMPMIPEAAIVLLAIGYLGAIAVPAFSGYGAAALATRLNDAGATVLVAADTLIRRGKRNSTLLTLRETVAATPSLQHILLWSRVDRESNEELAVDAFMFQAEKATVETYERQIPSVKVHGWQQALAAQADHARGYKPAILDAQTPYLLLYTSGSTGVPKGTVHPHIGFPLKVAIDQYLCFDMQPGDRMLWYTDMGWMMGPFLVLGALLLGSTAVLYDGALDYPSPDRLWAVAARHRVTHLGLAPTAVRALSAHGEEWPSKHNLTSLRILGSSGEPWNSTPYRWFLQHVGGGRAPIINYSGGTEIGGGILGCFPTMPLGPNAFHGPVPGMRTDVVNEEGKSVRGEVGELVLWGPWPGMTQSFWGGNADTRDDTRYLATYWERIPGLWTHGDWAEVLDLCSPDSTLKQRLWYIRGRSDDTIKVAGKRVGPAEFENVIVGHPEVREAAVFGIPDEIKGDAVVCLIVLRQKVDDFEIIRKELFDLVERGLGHALRPKVIKFVDDLPHTRNLKVMRRLARGRFLNEKNLGDLSSLENSAALNAIDAAY